MPGNRAWTVEEDALGKVMLQDGKSLEEIALALSRTRESVQIRKTKSWGVKRPGSGTREDFFDRLTPISAYVLGFIAADGNVRKDLREVSLSQSHPDGRVFLEQVQARTGGSLYGPLDNDAYRLSLMSVHLSGRLVELGIPPAKSKILEFRMHEPFDHFVRGIFDGDGGLCIDADEAGENFSASISSGSEPFLNGIRDEVSRRIGVGGSVTPPNEDHCGCLTWSANDAAAFLSWIYADVRKSLCLRRKFDLYLKIKQIAARDLDTSRQSVWRRRPDVEFSGYPETPDGYSAFHPATAERIVRNWSPPGGLIVDAFMGWGTRAEAAARLGRRYIGYDVSPDAVAAVGSHMTSRWPSDAYEIRAIDGCVLAGQPDGSVDLLLASPPYWRKEGYAGGSEQLSSAPTYEAFLSRMASAFSNFVRVLKPGGFCVAIVSDYRENDVFRRLSTDTERIAVPSGLVVWDEVIEVIGWSRAREHSRRSRMWSHSSQEHQNILVFRKPGGPDWRPPQEVAQPNVDASTAPEETRRGGGKRSAISPSTEIKILDLLKTDKTWGEISDETGVSRATLMRWRRHANIPDRPKGGRGRGGGTSEGARKRWAKPGAKGAVSAAMADYWSDPENRSAQSRRISEWHDGKPAGDVAGGGSVEPTVGSQDGSVHQDPDRETPASNA